MAKKMIGYRYGGIKKKQAVGHTQPYSTAPYNTFKGGGYAIPKHAIGDIIGGAQLGLSIYNTIKANREAKQAARFAKNQRTEQLLTEDQYILDEYPTTGNEGIQGFYRKGGRIYIKPSKRGTFTTAAKKRGMGVQPFANKVMSNKGNYSTAMVKKANFAKNAAKWKKQDGGKLDMDSVLAANMNVPFVNRIAEGDTTSIQIPNVKGRSTHYMASGDNYMFPTVQKVNGKLKYLGDKAFDTALKNKNLIKFNTPEEANEAALRYKDTDLWRTYENKAKGGNINLVGYNAKGGDLIPLSGDVDLVDGNTHEQDTIDNTNGVKLLDVNGRPVAEVEDEEVIKDNTKVYSDRLKVKVGKKFITYAAEAEKLGKEKGMYEKELADPNVGRFKKNSLKLKIGNRDRALEDLFFHQEEMKIEKGIDNDNTNVAIPKGQFGMAIGQQAVTNTGAFANRPTTAINPTFGDQFKKAIPYLDNITNAILTATTPKPAFPLLARQRKLKTTLNIDPQLQEVTDTVSQITGGIERGTSSSNVAQQRVTATRLAGMKEKGKLFGKKEWAETELETRDILNRQQVEGQNLARIQGFQDTMQERAYRIQGRTAANVANIVEDVNKQERADALKVYQEEQLDVLSKTYDVKGTSLRADLNNPYETESLRINSTYREAKSKQYLARDTNGEYIHPREAQQFLLMFPEYK